MNTVEDLKRTMLAMDFIIGMAQEIGDEKKAKVYIDCVMSKVDLLKDQWQLVWGPSLGEIWWSKTNAIFITQSIANPDKYALVINGTPSVSPFDWIWENLNIGIQYPWPYRALPQAKISEGAKLGLKILQGLAPKPGIPGETKTVAMFLQEKVQEAKGDVTLYVTGHSLGATLAPVTALWLHDTQGPTPPDGQLPWDPNKKATVKIYAFAGPTPGNGDFADLINSQFPGDSLVVVNNTLDIGPKAWNYETMKELTSLYPQPYDFPGWLDGIYDALIKKLQDYGYRGIGKNDQLQPIYGNIDNTIDKTGVPFINQALHQHTIAYADGLGLDIKELQKIVNDCTPK